MEAGFPRGGTGDALPFCPICAKYDYLTPDNPHHQDVFHADKSLGHVNFAAITDRVRALEQTVAAMEEWDQDLELLRQDMGDMETNHSISQHSVQHQIVELSTLAARIANLEAIVGRLVAHTAPDLVDYTPGSPWATDGSPTKK